MVVPMGDICDMNDIARIMRCAEGEACLEEIRGELRGRTIREVAFSNEVHFIGIALHLDNGVIVCHTRPSLDVEALREQYAAVLEREFHIDYPKRNAGGESCP
jgi:hypothetical protein